MRNRWIRETLSRRAALKSAFFGAAGLAMLGRTGLPAWAGPTVPATRKPGKAKAVIELWMAGGPSHIDTFDPKPGAGADYTGPLA